MDGHGNTSEEATSARGTKSTIRNPRWRCLNTTLPSPRPLMWHGVPCPRPMPLQPHVFRTSRPYPEGRQRTPNFTLPRGPFGILANLGIGGASLGHPSHLQRGLCAGSSSSRRPKGQADRALRQGPPREHQSTQKVSTPTDVGGLAHSDENRSSRHLSSTPESFVTFLALEGGPMSQERPMSPTHQHPHVPRQTVQQEAPQSRPSQGEHPGGTPHPPVEATIENPNASVSQSPNRSQDVMRLPPEPDVRLDEVQRDFVRSKEEVGETTKGGSPFAPEILDKPIPSNFRLSALEPYDGSTDPTEHVAAFRAHMALYDTSDALMCRTLPTTLRGPTRMWYSRMKSSSISSFDRFAKEFELNFIASSCPRPTAASLLDLTQGNDEPLA
ncbi:hypothetical protein B296_00032986 [Ensete ventricosum]|uniref:Retrotransposon gag domain-containing protein n=1 Tax=Ensete ventricosum TaxID=4639 RepID=A0A426YH38_ENSVE|nr:hypothetical protein B296_00032986 [Ensete ventricosum]